MKFESVKCDQCQRIQDQANHWIRVEVWSVPQGFIGIMLGEGILGCMTAKNNLNMTTASSEIHDLCGQACAIKHLAKLLGWSAPTEGV